MTIIDHAIEDVAGRFGLGPKGGQLMHEVGHLVTGSPGGVSGFIDKFSRPRLRSHLMVRQNRRSGAGGSAGREGARQQRTRRDSEHARPWDDTGTAFFRKDLTSGPQAAPITHRCNHLPSPSWVVRRGVLMERIRKAKQKSPQRCLPCYRGIAKFGSSERSQRVRSARPLCPCADRTGSCCPAGHVIVPFR
jgi:hypothetical protein